MPPDDVVAMRRQTNTYGDYYVSADPSTSEVNTRVGHPGRGLDPIHGGPVRAARQQPVRQGRGLRKLGDPNRLQRNRLHRQRGQVRGRGAADPDHREAEVDPGVTNPLPTAHGSQGSRQEVTPRPSPARRLCRTNLSAGECGGGAAVRGACPLRVPTRAPAPLRSTDHTRPPAFAVCVALSGSQFLQPSQDLEERCI